MLYMHHLILLSEQVFKTEIDLSRWENTASGELNDLPKIAHNQKMVGPEFELRFIGFWSPLFINTMIHFKSRGTAGGGGLKKNANKTSSSTVFIWAITGPWD